MMMVSSEGEQLIERGYLTERGYSQREKVDIMERYFSEEREGKES